MREKTQAKRSTSNDVEIARIRWGAIKWIATGGWLCLGLGIVAWAAVKLAATMAKPGWLVLLGSIISSLAAPSYVVYYFVLKVRRYTARTMRRQAQLERQCDPDRSSSDLMEDGTDPPRSEP